MIRIGVTGTDTGVGKTVVSCAIVAGMRKSIARVAAMKPIESGGCGDAECLQRATAMMYPMRLVCPMSFVEPLAPMVAAQRANIDVDLQILQAAFNEMCATSDAVVVEGAGGLLVPITDTESFATLFRRWDLDIVVVAANRLGVINHTLLTVRAAREVGLRVRAVVLNSPAGDPQGVAELTNLALLRELLPDIAVIPFAFTGRPDNPPHISLSNLGFDEAI